MTTCKLHIALLCWILSGLVAAVAVEGGPEVIVYETSGIYVSVPEEGSGEIWTTFRATRINGEWFTHIDFDRKLPGEAGKQGIFDARPSNIRPSTEAERRGAIQATGKFDASPLSRVFPGGISEENKAFLVLVFQAYGGNAEAILEMEKKLRSGKSFSDALAETMQGELTWELFLRGAGKALSRSSKAVFDNPQARETLDRALTVVQNRINGTRAEALISAIIGVPKNSRKFPTFTRSGENGRIPDFVNGDTIHEVKNVKDLPLTEQLRDTAALVGKRWDPDTKMFVDGENAFKQFEFYVIHVRPDTNLSGPLQGQIRTITDEFGVETVVNPNGVFDVRRTVSFIEDLDDLLD